MCLSSLVGEKMFNTSEFIEKDFFKIMSNSKYDWIFKLILSFNSAKVDQFEQMLNNYKDNINSEEILRNNVQLIQVNIRIAALLDLIFQKNKNERVLSFKEISQVCFCSMQDIDATYENHSPASVTKYDRRYQRKFLLSLIKVQYVTFVPVVVVVLYDSSEHPRVSTIASLYG